MLLTADVINKIDVSIKTKNKELEKEKALLKKAEKFLKKIVEKNYHPLISNINRWNICVSEVSRYDRMNSIMLSLYVKNSQDKLQYIDAVEKTFDITLNNSINAFSNSEKKGGKIITIDGIDCHFKVMLTFSYF